MPNWRNFVYLRKNSNVVLKRLCKEWANSTQKVPTEIPPNKQRPTENNNVCKHCLRFSYEFSKSCQSLDFPSLACLHMPSVASAHAQ